MSDGQMPRPVKLAVITTMVVLAVATVVFALLAIWNTDPRWGWTALVAGGLAFMAALGLIIDGTPERSRTR